MVSMNIVNIKPVFISLQKFSKKQILKCLYIWKWTMEKYSMLLLLCNFSLFTVSSLAFYCFFTSAFILKDEKRQTWFLIWTVYSQPRSLVPLKNDHVKGPACIHTAQEPLLDLREFQYHIRFTCSPRREKVTPVLHLIRLLSCSSLAVGTELGSCGCFLSSLWLINWIAHARVCVCVRV